MDHITQEHHLTLEEIEAGLAAIGISPQTNGTLEMIVCRPVKGERRLLESGELNQEDGLHGDVWRVEGSRHTSDGSSHPAMQVTLMNTRILQSISPDKSRWQLAGDQLYVDFDLSADNLPPGQRIAIGSAILEISEIPHTGCAKFTERFGSGATHFVNSREGRAQRRRGVNARVIQAGVVRVGDTITKFSESRMIE